MRAALINTRLGAILLRRRIDKLLGFPRKGVQVGGGVHVKIPDTWDGIGERPPGWTKQFTRSRRHALRAEWSVQVTPEILEALQDARASRLTLQERNALQNAYNSAVELDSSWDDAAEDDDE